MFSGSATGLSLRPFFQPTACCHLPNYFGPDGRETVLSTRGALDICAAELNIFSFNGDGPKNNTSHNHTTNIMYSCLKMTVFSSGPVLGSWI